MYLLHLFVY